MAGTYVYGYGYSAYNGAQTSVSYPAGADLAAEQVTTGYDQITGLPRTLTSAWSTVGSLVSQQQYTSYGEPTLTFGDDHLTAGLESFNIIRKLLPGSGVTYHHVVAETARGYATAQATADGPATRRRGPRWDPASWETLNRAVTLAGSTHHRRVGPDHLVAALLANPQPDLTLLFDRLDINTADWQANLGRSLRPA